MNHDAVFYGVIVCVVGAAIVMCWLLYVAFRHFGGSDKK